MNDVEFAMTEGDMNVDLLLGVLLLSFGLLVPVLVLQPGRRREFNAPAGGCDARK